MKRIKRNPEKFDVPELFAAVAQKKDYRIDDLNDIEEFVGSVRDSLIAVKDNTIFLHGKRTEAMFASVAAALGVCSLVKQEDAGDAFYNNSDLLAPDYRIILKNGD